VPATIIAAALFRILEMANPQIIKSPLSRVVEEGGVSVDVHICRVDNTGWSLEILAEDGTSTVWDDLFSDEIALGVALRAIKKNGIRSFSQVDPNWGASSICHL
jgi:hypothetical protein